VLREGLFADPRQKGRRTMQQILDERIALISVSASIFGGYRRATKEMIRELGGSLPDSKAVTQGSIRVFPSDSATAPATKGKVSALGTLASLGTIRRAAFRELGAKGIKALGSRSVFAIPAEARDEIGQLLDAAEIEFKEGVLKLQQTYDQQFEDHVKESPEAESILRRLKVDKADAVAKCHFTWTPFQITPLARKGQDQEKGVATVLASLGGQLFQEVADEFADILKKDGFVSGKVGQKFLRPIKAQVAKMEGLAFLDDAVPGAIAFVKAVLGMLPKEGYIEAAEFDPLQKMVNLCADVETLVDAACRTRNGVSVETILTPPVAAAPVAAAPVAAAPVVAAPVVAAPVVAAPVVAAPVVAAPVVAAPVAAAPVVAAPVAAAPVAAAPVAAAPVAAAPVVAAPVVATTGSLFPAETPRDDDAPQIPVPPQVIAPVLSRKPRQLIF
jgi:hypothetical protein